MAVQPDAALIIEHFPAAMYQAKPDPNDPKGELHEVMEAAPFAPALGQDVFKLAIDRTLLPDTTALVVKCRAEISLDNGSKWQLLVAFTTSGGNLLTIDGQPGTESSATVALPEPKNTNRLLRVQFIPLKDVQTRVVSVCDVARIAG